MPPFKKKMSTEKASVDISDTNNGSNEESERMEPRTNEMANLGKAIAHRALHGSGRRRARRVIRNNDAARVLPSRLSRVSLADENES